MEESLTHKSPALYLIHRIISRLKMMIYVIEVKTRIHRQSVPDSTAI